MMAENVIESSNLTEPVEGVRASHEVESRTLGASVKPRRVKAIPKDEPDAPYVGLEHIEPHTMKLLGTVPAGTMKSAGNRFFAGDVLYSRLRPYLNKVWLADRDGICSGEFIVLPPPPDIDPAWLAYRLHSQDFVHFANSLNAGDRPRVDFDQLSSFPFLLPSSLATQRDIVAKLDEQFSRLDAGVAALRRAQANLKRYRASVLKAACEGRLVPTEASLAREEVRRAMEERGEWKPGMDSSLIPLPSSFESGSQLLARILEERRASWSGKGKYKPPTLPDTTNLPELPEGWTWASLDQLLAVLRNGTSAKPVGSEGLRILRISAVRVLKVDPSDIRYLGPASVEYDEYALSAGDLLFTRYNGNPEFVGVAAVVPPLQHPLVHPDKLIRCELVPGGALPPYVAVSANTGPSRKFMKLRVRTTAGQAGISGSDLKEMPIALPPLAEQERILSEVERRLSVVDALEVSATASVLRSSRLRQSVLHKAMSHD